MNVILLEPAELALDLIRLEGPRARHVVEVLAPELGARLRIGVIDGALGTARVARIEDAIADGPLVVLDDITLEPEAPPLPKLDLLLALPRPKVLARLLSPIAQLGVRRLFLAGAWKVERFYFDAHVLQPEELRSHLVEGLAQAKDTRLPGVSVHRSLTYLVRDELPALLPAGTKRVVLDPSGTPLERVLEGHAKHALLAIGPEGGFTAREGRLLEEYGFATASLGDRTLRSDVAVIAALARAHALLGRPAG